MQDCILAPNANGIISFGGPQGLDVLRNCTVDFSAESSNQAASPLQSGASCKIRITGLSFINAQYRTGTVYSAVGNATDAVFDGCDFSGFTNATACEVMNAGSPQGSSIQFVNCKMVPSWVPFSTFTAGRYSGRVEFFNCGDADAPTYMYARDGIGDALASAIIYRTSGAAVEGDACSWLITTTANCAEGAPFYTPWIYGTVNSTGSKTFDCYITNDTADFTDAQVWLEVEYLATADEAQWSLATDQRATITTTAVAQTDDTTSTWNGTGPAFTYKQKLSVTATVGETGQYRARVAVGVASITGSRFFYIDNHPVVS
jgi:hypothetical protein